MDVDFSLILAYRFQEYSWVLDGNDYGSLKWFSEDREKPTLDEFYELWPEVKKEITNFAASHKRRQEYSKTADPVFFKWQRGEATEQEWLDAVKSVKDKYPYAGE